MGEKRGAIRRSWQHLLSFDDARYAGRHVHALSIDQARPPGLLLIEPGSGDAFEIDESFVDYFNVNVVDDPDTFLATDLFQDWQSAGGRPPGNGECVGFKVPLFLGGAGAASNLELTDLGVYWSFAAQLRVRTQGLPSGTRISGVGIEEA
jgi:type VI secretion system (T6SS) immunity protein Tdi1